METFRKDHCDLYTGVTNSLSLKPKISYLYEIPKRLSIHPLLWINVINRVLKNLKNQRIGFVDKLHWAVEYVYLVQTICVLDSIDFSRVNKYLCMCHILSMENLLTQYLRKKGVITFSLEEGIYMVYKKNIVLGSIAYELFETDHLLCWGQYTKDEYIAYGINPDRIDVAGYPKCHYLADLKTPNAYQKCLVMLAGPIFGDVNAKLLDILDNMSDEYDITLKSHPANYEIMMDYAKSHGLKILPKTQTVNDCLNTGNYDFCIAVNTTAYYESWMAGIPCVRYFDERFDNFFGFEDLFSTREELISMINEYRSTPKSKDEVIKMLEYAIGFGLDNYDKLINS
jgi:hypothetical protein